MDTSKLHSLFLDSTGISTDTRKIKQDNIFFALKGENFNGNTYANQALESGASYAVVDEKEYATNERSILVPDCLKALQKEPAKRFQSMLELIAALHQCQRELVSSYED